MTFEIGFFSCSPNCTMQKWNVQGVPHIIIVAGNLNRHAHCPPLGACDCTMDCCFVSQPSALQRARKLRTTITSIRFARLFPPCSFPGVQRSVLGVGAGGRGAYFRGALPLWCGGMLRHRGRQAQDDRGQVPFARAIVCSEAIAVRLRCHLLSSHAQSLALGGGRLVQEPDVTTVQKRSDGWFEPTVLATRIAL